MQESPATRASLLVRLRDGGDVGAWQEFVHLYAPTIYGFARKRGLQDADAADLMQEVLRSVSTAGHRPAASRNRTPARGRAMSVSSKCPSSVDLRELLEGNGADSDQAAVVAHLDRCPSCQQSLEALANGDSSFTMTLLEQAAHQTPE